MTTAVNGLGGVAGSYIVRQQEAPRYVTAVWVIIGWVLAFRVSEIGAYDRYRAQIVMIGIILIFSVYFFLANRKQRKSGKLIEGTVGLTCATFDAFYPLLT